MTTRRFHPTSYWVQSFTEEQWTSIESAGLISLSSEQRQILQSAYEKFQFHCALDGAGASPSAIKDILSRIAKLEDGCAALCQLLGDEALAQAAFYELRVASALDHAPIPERAQLSVLCEQLKRCVGGASRAMKSLPDTGRGRISKRWTDNFFELAQRLFEQAGGEKRLRSAYLRAVRKAIGYKSNSSEQTFIRKPDKTRRRQRVG